MLAQGQMTLVSLCLALAGGIPWSADDPSGVGAFAGLSIRADRPASDVSPLFLFLDGEADFQTLLSRLANPDLVVLTGERYRALLQAAEREAPRGGDVAAPIIESLVIAGSLGDEIADLRLSFSSHVPPGTYLLPIRLNGQTLRSVESSGKDLRVESKEGSWWVELTGPGEIEFDVSLEAEVSASPEGDELSLEIPVVASTSLELSAPTDVTTFHMAGQVLAPAGRAVDGDPGVYRARITPRSRLELAWSRARPEDLRMSPVLTSVGQLEIRALPGTLDLRATYELRCERGRVETLQIDLDPEDQLIDVEVEGLPAVRRLVTGEGSRLLEVFLSDPIIPGAPQKLRLSTRRKIPDRGFADLRLRGFPMRGVEDQSGLIAISGTGQAWLGARAGTGLRRVDPGTDLPPSLRLKTENLLAYEYLEQPFDLMLQVDATPPWLGVESQTNVAISETHADIRTSLKYRIVRGQLFEVRLLAPAGLRLERFGPESSVVSADLRPRDPGDPDDGDRILVLTLTSQARDSGSFVVDLAGRQELDASGHVEIGLFRPLEVGSTVGTLSVTTTRSQTVSLAESDSFRVIAPPPPSERRVAGGPIEGLGEPALWIGDPGRAERLPLDIATNERIVRCSERVDATVGRDRLDVLQDLDFRVSYGTLGSIELMIPEQIEGLWEVEGAQILGRSPLGDGAGGARIYRLELAQAVADRLSLRVRSSLNLAGLSGEVRGRDLTIPTVRPVGCDSVETRVRVHAEAGLRLEGDGPGWVRERDRDGGSPSLSLTIDRGREGRPGPTEDSPNPIIVRAHADPLKPLPGLVASRNWIRSDLDPTGLTRVSSYYYVDVHGSSMAFELPRGAELGGIRVGRAIIEEVESLSRPSAYRFNFPAGPGTDPILVSLTYSMKSADLETLMTPPRLLDGARVERCFWQVRVPWDRAIVGAPGGWNDENAWSWGQFLFQRRSRLTPAVLAEWVTPAMQSNNSLWSSLGWPEGGDCYLFSSADSPARLPVRLVPRLLLIGGFSAIALALGLGLLLGSTVVRLVGLSCIILVLLGSATWHPSLLLIGIQYSTLGVLLTALAAATRRVVERGGRRSARPSESEPPGAFLSPNSTMDPGVEVSRDLEGSTVIRTRVGTTVERFAPRGDEVDRATAEDAP